MFDKIINILGSVRFWQVLIAFVVLYIGDAGGMSVALSEAIAGMLGVSVGIGTIDKFRNR